MSERTPMQQAPDDDMPTVEEDRPKNKAAGLVVAGLIAVGVLVVAGSFFLKKDGSATIKHEAEQFALRSARTPEPPPAATPQFNTKAAEQRKEEPKGDPETERRMSEMAERMAQAEMARRAEEEAKAKEKAQAAADAAKKKLDQRKASSILITSSKADSSSQEASPAQAAAPTSPDPFTRLLAAQQAAGGQPGGRGAAADSRPQPYAFLPDAKAARIEAVAAAYTGDQTFRISQGKFIPAVLETAIQSDLPGMIRAIVSEDVYGEDGSQVLIPAGSRLVGEYQSGLVRGQSRVAVIWHRVARPDGVDIGISSPGTDALGVAGLTGDVDSHFFARFGGSVLLSLIDVYGQRQSDQSIQVVSQDAKNASAIALQNSINIPPTVHVDQGTRIRVFVARDINFQSVIAQGFTVGSTAR